METQVRWGGWWDGGGGGRGARSPPALTAALPLSPLRRPVPPSPLSSLQQSLRLRLSARRLVLARLPNGPARRLPDQVPV